MSRLTTLAVALFAAAGTLLPAGVAQSADIVRAPDGAGGICAHEGALRAITGQFRHQVAHVPNLPNVDIVDFYRIHERRYLPETAERPIARRYCGATVQLSDGRERPVWYMIEYGQGFAGIGANVEFCVSGFDRWHVYNGGCRVLR